MLLLSRLSTSQFLDLSNRGFSKIGTGNVRPIPTPVFPTPIPSPEPVPAFPNEDLPTDRNGSIIRWQDVVSFEITHSMDNGPTATIELNNKDNYYVVQELLHTPVIIKPVTKIYTQSLEGESETATVTDSSVKFYGWVTGIDPSYELSGKHNIAISCTSFFNRLSRKPINTEKYGAEDSKYPTTITGQQLLSEVIGNYCKYNPQLYDFTASSGVSFENIHVSESSVSDALKKIAQVCENEVFIQEDGKLVTKKYKIARPTDFSEASTQVDVDDPNLPNIYEIPSHYLTNASTSINDEVSFSRVRVRGAYFEEIENLTPVTLDLNWDNVTGLPTQTVEIFVLSHPSSFSTTEGWENSTVTSVNPLFNEGFIQEAININGVIKLIISINVDSPLSTIGTGKSLSVIVTPKKLNTLIFSENNQKQNPPIKSGTNKAIKTLLNDLHKQNFKEDPGYRSLKPPDEAELNRFDVVVVDNQLELIVGVLWSEIDNQYIPDLAKCEVVGRRHLVEYKQNRRSWSIDSIYDPYITLNKKVRFKPPELNGIDISESGYIVGVVREVTIAWTSENSSLLMSANISELSR